MTSLTTETPAKYAVLMETNGEECESWLYFIKHDGNEDKLQHLLKQLEQIEMYIIDDLSTFDLDLDHLVSEQTAKDMTKIELNSVSFHRKFDGVMKTINLGLKRKDSNEKRIRRAHKALGLEISTNTSKTKTSILKIKSLSEVKANTMMMKI